MAKTAKVEKKTKKPEKVMKNKAASAEAQKKVKKAQKGAAAEMTPLEKARAARASGKGKPKGKSSAKKKPGLPVFKAPDEFKPFFARVSVRIGKDGLMNDLKVLRIKGSPTNEDAKTVDMAQHDPETLVRVAARYSGPSFIRNEGKRVPANSIVSFLMRVGVKKENNQLTTAFKEFKIKNLETKKTKTLEKSDPIYRASRKPARWMPAAFTGVKPFPTNAELKAMNKGEEEEVSVKVKAKSKSKPEKVVKKAEKVIKKVKKTVVADKKAKKSKK